MSDLALKIDALSVSVTHDALGMARTQLLDAVCLHVSKGDCLAIVGESGSGKSLTALSCARLLADGLDIDQGDVFLYNSNSVVNVLDLPRSQLANVRGKRLGFVFQEPSLALNPVLTIGEQLGEAIRLHSQLKGDALEQAMVQALEQVGIDEAVQRLQHYPMQFSGGQKQRIMIAIALAGNPDVLIADEPTTALDVLVQTQILELLKSLQLKQGMTLVLISHDLAIVKRMADVVAVMQSGRVVEFAAADVFFSNPQHPCSQLLLEATQVSHQQQRTTAQKPVALRVNGLNASYTSKTSFFGKTKLTPVLEDINFDLREGETLAIVGASGSGKTTLAKVLLGLQEKNLSCTGQLTIDGLHRQAVEMPSKDWKKAVSIVFQDPFASLNPRMRVGELVLEGVRQLRPEWSGAQADTQVQVLLEAVGLPFNCLERWPHEFSGGQRQRIAIVRALAVAPRLVVLDEPTSALDVTVQAKLLEMLADLQTRFGYSYLLITHNMQVVRAMSAQIAVLHEGRVVEFGETQTVLDRPIHEHTKTLLRVVLKV